MVSTTINETNREVKFIKATVLNNGSISLNYDYRISNDENIDKIIPHMILALYKASEYLIRKIEAFEEKKIIICMVTLHFALS